MILHVVRVSYEMQEWKIMITQTNVHDYVNDTSMPEDKNIDGTGTLLHFFDIIVQDDNISDSFVVLSCLKAGLTLHLRFPTIQNVILHKVIMPKKFQARI